MTIVDSLSLNYFIIFIKSIYVTDNNLKISLIKNLSSEDELIEGHLMI